MRSSVSSGFRFAIATPIPYSIAYTILAIVLLTLNPFGLQAYDPAEWWVWRFWLSDVCQNILLFLPLGMLLKHHFRMSYGLCLASGLFLSLSIESTQLFIPERTSNGIDLIANSVGCGIGAWLYHWLYHWSLAGWGRKPQTLRTLKPPRQLHSSVSLAIMLLPLCWIRAMIAEWQPNGIWILLPSAIALLTLLEPKPQSNCLFNLAQGAWLALALLPSITYAPLRLAAIVGAALLFHLVARNSQLSRQGLSCAILGIGLGLLMSWNGRWLKSQTLYVGQTWYNLLWIELLLSVLLTVAVARQQIAER